MVSDIKCLKLFKRSDKEYWMSQLTEQDKKNMEAIIRTTMGHRAATRLKSLNNAFSKKDMEQGYIYNEKTNKFIKAD